MSIRTYFAALALVLLVVSCSVPQGSTAQSKPSPSSPPPSPAAPLPTVTSSAGLATLEACDLLTTQEAGSLGMRPQGRAEKILGLRRCEWTTPDGESISTGINENRGMERLNLADTSSVIEIKVGRHQAKRAQDGRKPGYCEIDFTVGSTASVNVLALYPNDTTRACTATDQAAAIVEPKLP